jgi:hypothetical protein
VNAKTFSALCVADHLENCVKFSTALQIATPIAYDFLMRLRAEETDCVLGDWCDVATKVAVMATDLADTLCLMCEANALRKTETSEAAHG